MCIGTSKRRQNTSQKCVWHHVHYLLLQHRYGLINCQTGVHKFQAPGRLSNSYVAMPNIFSIIFLLGRKMCVTFQLPSRKRQTTQTHRTLHNCCLSAWNLLYATLLPTIIWRWLLDFWTIFRTLLLNSVCVCVCAHAHAYVRTYVKCCSARKCHRKVINFQGSPF